MDHAVAWSSKSMRSLDKDLTGVVDTSFGMLKSLLPNNTSAPAMENVQGAEALYGSPGILILALKFKADEYLSRAELLKKHLASQGEGCTGTSAAVVDDQDVEVKKLWAGLSSAILSENLTSTGTISLEGAKDSLKEAVIFPVKFPQLFTSKRTPWNGILFYGPPGTGKSYLAQAVITEAKSTFFSISSCDLISKWQGDSEGLIKQLFELAHESKPSIIFIDEIDSLAGSRNEGEPEGSRQIKTELLVQMNGVGQDNTGVLILGATNIPAIKRRCRIHIPLPAAEARRRMFQLHVGSPHCDFTAKDHQMLVDRTEGYSDSDISVVRDALLGPYSPGDPDAVEKMWSDLESHELKEPQLKLNDFLKSLGTVQSEADTRQHAEWTKEFGCTYEEPAQPASRPLARVTYLS
ncbi:AAA-domain-containing protein [Armillaria solidipes]|uniref:AAA-domain-containing protein n=1 Tax=Armillaria solidipes TaxID=1076256 RepID=A0A2H3C118_9AGAR|nr:AAA-domain-containing protein [Armillaria solidipes]